MLEALEIFAYSGDGPIDRAVLDSVIYTTQDRLDLLTLMREVYGAEFEASGERWKTYCFLPSTVDSFAGTCAEQDAADKSGAIPANLWVSEGDNTRVWRCHSCGRRGDVVDLIEHAEQLKRNPGQVVSLSAVRHAAKLAGLTYLLDGRLPDDRDDPSEALVNASAPVKIVKPPTARVDFTRARALNARAAKHWHAMLKSGPGYVARNELKRRGVTDEQRDRFVLGFAADEWRDLVDVMPKSGMGEAQVLGLIGTTKERNYYDRYRNRLVWPYCEPARDGRRQSVTGFAGRTLTTGEDVPKWFNSKNTASVWEKSSALLGLLQAQTLMRRLGTDRITVGEGGWEILAFDRIDAPCVALVSAPMSIDHVHVLATVLQAKRVTLAGDGDLTGRRGMIASALSLLKYGYPVEDIDTLDAADGSDPGKLGESAEGTEELRLAWESPAPFVDFLREREDVAAEQQKRALIKTLPLEYAREFAERWDMSCDRGEEANTEDLSPPAYFAAMLAATPSLAAHFDGEEVREVFAAEPLTLSRVDGSRFGDTTSLQSLAPALRKAWLTCSGAWLERELKTHDKRAPFQYLPEGGHASFAAWHSHGDALRARSKKTRKTLAAL